MLDSNIDYTILGYDNVFPGIGRAIVKGVGEYSGYVPLEYRIVYNDNICDLKVVLSVMK